VDSHQAPISQPLTFGKLSGIETVFATPKLKTAVLLQKGLSDWPQMPVQQSICRRLELELALKLDAQTIFAIRGIDGQVFERDGNYLFPKPDPFWSQDHSSSIAEDDLDRLARILCHFESTFVPVRMRSHLFAWLWLFAGSCRFSLRRVERQALLILKIPTDFFSDLWVSLPSALGDAEVRV